MSRERCAEKSVYHPFISAQQLVKSCTLSPAHRELLPLPPPPQLAAPTPFRTVGIINGGGLVGGGVLPGNWQPWKDKLWVAERWSRGRNGGRNWSIWISPVAADDRRVCPTSETEAPVCFIVTSKLGGKGIVCVSTFITTWVGWKKKTTHVCTGCYNIDNRWDGTTDLSDPVTFSDRQRIPSCWCHLGLWTLRPLSRTVSGLNIFRSGWAIRLRKSCPQPGNQLKLKLGLHVEHTIIIPSEETGETAELPFWDE